MTEEIHIEQNIEKGKDNTSIAVQNNYYESSLMSATEVCQAAFAMFRDYYPQLKQEALSELRGVVETEIAKIAPQNVLPPRAKTAVPLLQNASITEEESLRKMYARVLASDMNKEYRSIVHPAYVEIINQMSANDAELFRKIVEINDSIPLARVTFNFDNQYLTSVLPRFFSPYFEDGDPWEVSVSIENLSRLNVIDFFEGTVTSYNYENIKYHAYIQERYAYAKAKNPNRILNIKLSERAIQLSDFGKSFAKVCL